jgi:hypothetical protein
MTIETDVNLRAAFTGAPGKTPEPAPEVPERIRKDAPRPALRPGGSWAPLAGAVDQNVREAQDAAKARQNEWAARKSEGAQAGNEWAARIKSRRQGKGMGYGHCRSGEE